jgi:hypothetical protein
MFKLEKLERLLLGVVLALLALAIWGPWMAQPAHHHDFADRRMWGALPFAMDVLSNLPFALWGAWGLGLIWSLTKKQAAAACGLKRGNIQTSLAAVFFAGLLMTAGASSWYHLQPHDAGLVFDRLGMTVAFAGLLGLAAAGRVTARAGVMLAGTVLVLGPLSIWAWSATGNILPWAVVQFGGMALVLWLACLKPLPQALPINWFALIGIYALAKLLELADHQVFDLTGHLVSGHSLKHVVASFAAWPVLVALKGWAQTVQTPDTAQRGTKHRGEVINSGQNRKAFPRVTKA